MLSGVCFHPLQFLSVREISFRSRVLINATNPKVVIQIAGQYFVSGAQAAQVTDAVPMFAVGTSMLLYIAGNVLQVIFILIALIHGLSRTYGGGLCLPPLCQKPLFVDFRLLVSNSIEDQSMITY